MQQRLDVGDLLDVTVRVEGQPQPKAYHQRHDGGRYLDPKCRGWQEQVGWAWKAALPSDWKPSTEGLFRVELLFLVRGRMADVDNLAKAAIDAGTGVVWNDDVQVVELEANRGRRSVDAPRMVMRIVELAPGQIVAELR